MTDRVRRRGLALALACAALAVAPPVPAAAPAQPVNVIVILVDDLGYGDLGVYGNESVETPHIDALARGGIRFSDFHANSPSCSPTRAALLTGRYPQRVGIERALTLARDRETGLPPEEVTLAEVLTQAGYATALLGKWHLGYEPALGPLRQGFGTFRGFLAGGLDYHSHVTRAGTMDWWHDDTRTAEAGYTTDLLTDHAVRFIERNRERPFFALVSYQAVHYPYQTREDEPYRVAGRTYWQNPRDGGASEPRVAYPEMLRALDDGVGRLVAALARLGLERRTLVFLTSDNGGDEEVANHAGFRGFKDGLAEGGHRVPAIASWPGRIAAGRIVTDVAMTMDLFPTVAALAGATLPADLAIDGVDLGPALLEGRRLPVRSVFWRYGKSSAVRRGRWKLLVTPKLQALLDLEKDPAERFNVWSAQPALATQLLRKLERWEAQWPAPDAAGPS